MNDYVCGYGIEFNTLPYLIDPYIDDQGSNKCSGHTKLEILTLLNPFTTLPYLGK